VSHALEYIEEHAHKARGLNKPLILEEFGLARDGQSADAAHSAVVHRDAFYAAVVRAAGASAGRGAWHGVRRRSCSRRIESVRCVRSCRLRVAADRFEVSGVMPWAWGGGGRPREPGGYWRPGDELIGDPPHEPQGW
jgi:mannan endo-1,4-beta-mannosidase